MNSIKNPAFAERDELSNPYESGIRIDCPGFWSRLYRFCRCYCLFVFSWNDVLQNCWHAANVASWEEEILNPGCSKRSWSSCTWPTSIFKAEVLLIENGSSHYGSWDWWKINMPAALTFNLADATSLVETALSVSKQVPHLGQTLTMRPSTTGISTPSHSVIWMADGYINHVVEL